MTGNQEQGFSYTNRKILDAAARLFSEFGYYGASTRTIAKASGVTEATLFRHFQRKRDLYIASIRSIVSQLTVSQEQFDRLLNATSHDALMAGALDLVHEFVTQGPYLVRLLQYLALDRSTEVDASIRSDLSRILGELSHVLNAGRRRDGDADLDVSDALLTLIAIAATRSSLMRITGMNSACATEYLSGTQSALTS